MQAEHCPGTRGSQSSLQRTVAMSLRGTKGNEPTDGETGFLGALAMTPGRQKAKSRIAWIPLSQESRALEHPQLGLGCRVLLLPKASTRMGHGMSHCYCEEEIFTRPPMQTLRELLLKSS